MEQETIEQPIKCHEHAPFAGVNGPTRWEKREGMTRHCSYCGSIHPEDLRQSLEAGAIRLGGSDWKYGYPHKFYVYPQGKPGSISGKFYTKHLLDLDNEAFAILVPLLKQYTNIEFIRNEDGETFYRAPYHGYQRS